MLLSEIVSSPVMTVDQGQVMNESEQVISQMEAHALIEIPVLRDGRWAGVFRIFPRAVASEGTKKIGIWIQDAPCLVEDTEITEMQFPVGCNVVGVVNKEEQFVGILDVVEWQTIFHNILDEALTRSRQLDAVIDYAYDGILIADELGYVRRVNPAFCRLAGVREAEFEGLHLTELVKKGIFKEQSVTWKSLQERREVVGLQRYPTGQEHLVSAVTIFDENGNITGAVSTIRDMTELARLRVELDTIQNQSQRYQSELSNLRKQVLSEEIISVSPQMSDVMELASRVANFDSTVLILGESGVGKEVIASYIHKASARSKGPFVKINCGALPDELLESELFGYESGAFTGARRTGKVGLFEASEGGVIFLDEIGEMSPNLQVKLLRVLQEHQFTRVGGVETIQVNCRVIAATHRNLQQRIEEGMFREDLYYRLYVVPIYIPPLRERREDIPALIQYFLNRYNKKYGTQKMIHPVLIQMLQNYPWPGNVRQVANLIERMVVTVPKTMIEPDHLPPDFINSQNRSAKSLTTSYESPAGVTQTLTAASSHIPETSQWNAFDEMERDLILQTLARYGSMRKVGKALGVSHTTVIKKMRKYGIERPVKHEV